MRFYQLVILFLLSTFPIVPVLAQDIASAPLTAEAINASELTAVPAEFLPPEAVDSEATGSGDAPPPRTPDPAIAKLQILLDRAGASPGVIDGYDGENVRKAVRAFSEMRGLATTDTIDAGFIAALETREPVVGAYEITAEDVAAIVAPIPDDYAEKAKRDFLGYAGVSELVAERFHMDEKLLVALNPGARFVAGESVWVAAYGPDMTGTVVRLEADKTTRQLRGYDAEGRLIVAYPATIGSETNPSPTGTHLVAAVAPMPNYTYNPAINFQQGENTDILIIPPGPNGPVGSMWIDLTEPTFGIHGTPEPSAIDKTASHGCVRLTNWDAEELAKMVEPGVPVEFLG